MLKITDLPLEIQLQIISQAPVLKLTSTYYYILYHQLYQKHLINEFSVGIFNIIKNSLIPLISYIKSLDSIRFCQRSLVARALKLSSYESQILGNNKRNNGEPELDITQIEFISDSWPIIYSLLKSPKFFFDINDFISIQKFDNNFTSLNYKYHQSKNIMSFNRIHSFTFQKSIFLSNGYYILNLAVSIKNYNFGLGTIKFQIFNKIESNNDDNDIKKLISTFYLSNNIDELMPKNKIVVLNLGKFKVENDNLNHSLNEIYIEMEEIGSMPIHGINFYYFDIKPMSSHIFQNYYDYKYFNYNYFYWFLN
ncbi:Ucc1p ASCRUDRAFT_31184, partial [Ascoidea rubescens DSM 1968]